ncbi:MAG: 30S ribosomal protein S8 [Candidatus Nomurabacteria bacterium]|nr:MAG: 30S ribosomal protein S8 [Candidatus Nomurabacteria bacterium]
MSMSDPISDFLTRLRNAVLAGQWQLESPYSKLKLAILDILKQEGYVESYSTDEGRGVVTIMLQKAENGHPVLRSIRRVSRPGHRIYVKRQSLPRVVNDYGIAIVSTSQGVMTNREARKRSLGGEVICEVS